MIRILILGATGPTGILLIRQALQKYKSCSLILYARSPQKIPDDLANNPSIVIVQGELQDTDKLAEAMEGVEVVLSALGPSVKRGPFHPSDTPIALAYLYIIDLMLQHGVKRLICLGTASIEDPQDKSNLAFSIIVKTVKTLARNAYNDVVAIGDVVRTSGADLDWTIVRVPFLRDGDSSNVVAGYVGDGKTSTSLTRLGFAVFVVGEIENREWVQKAPLLSSA